MLCSLRWQIFEILALFALLPQLPCTRSQDPIREFPLRKRVSIVWCYAMSKSYIQGTIQQPNPSQSRITAGYIIPESATTLIIMRNVIIEKQPMAVIDEYSATRCDLRQYQEAILAESMKYETYVTCFIRFPRKKASVASSLRSLFRSAFSEVTESCFFYHRKFEHKSVNSVARIFVSSQRGTLTANSRR